MRAAAESAMIVVFTFQFSLLGMKCPPGKLKLDPFRERATSRYIEGVEPTFETG
jgi:hypothetical protein